MSLSLTPLGKLANSEAETTNSQLEPEPQERQLDPEPQEEEHTDIAEEMQSEAR